MELLENKEVLKRLKQADDEESKYIGYDEALVVWVKTVAACGGLQGVKDKGDIRKVLDFVQNDLYYPTIVEKEKFR